MGSRPDPIHTHPVTPPPALRPLPRLYATQRNKRMERVTQGRSLWGGGSSRPDKIGVSKSAKLFRRRWRPAEDSVGGKRLVPRVAAGGGLRLRSERGC